MQSETVIIMIVGLVAIGLIRLVIAMVGREFAADHPKVKTKSDVNSAGSELVPAVPVQRPVRGTGRKSHLLYLPEADETAPEDPASSDVNTEPAAS